MNTARKIYLITGVAGFIGSNICKTLLSKQSTDLVIGIDNLNGYYSPKIKEHRLSTLLKDEKFIFCKISIEDQESLNQIIHTYKPTVLIHTAAEVGVNNGETHALTYFRTNVLGTLTVLEASKDYVRHGVIFSSSSVYGNSSNVPFLETENISLSTPISTYGASKASMEVGVNMFHRRTGIPVTIIRPFSVYGPNGRPDMLPLKILISSLTHRPLTMYSPMTLSRDWTYIDDFVHMFMAVLNEPNKLRIINIGQGSPIRLIDVIEIAQRVLKGYTLTLQYSIDNAKPFEMTRTWADTSKIKSLMRNDMSYTNFEMGFKKTAEFFFSHKELYML